MNGTRLEISRLSMLEMDAVSGMVGVLAANKQLHGQLNTKSR